MNPRFREIHRAEIRRLLNKRINWISDGLFGAFGLSIVVFSYGIALSRLPFPGSDAFGAMLMVFGVAVYTLYRWLVRTMARRAEPRKWLTLFDEAVCFAMVLTGVLFHNSGATALGILASCGYALWRLCIYSRPYVRHWYFRTAREYFRGIESYTSRPNNRLEPQRRE